MASGHFLTAFCRVADNTRKAFAEFRIVVTIRIVTKDVYFHRRLQCNDHIIADTSELLKLKLNRAKNQSEADDEQCMRTIRSSRLF